MSPHITWAKGGTAHVVSVSGDAIVLRSTTPSPPGSRIQGKLAGMPVATLRIKVHAARRQSEGDFVLEGRPLDLTRENRERLQAMLRGDAPAV